MTGITQVYGSVLNKGQKGYVTDNLIINRDNTAPLLSSPHLPDDLTKPGEKEEKNTEKTLLNMVAVPLGALGISAIITGLLAADFGKKSRQLAKGEVPPPLPRLTQLTKETEYAVFEFLRGPSKKTILGAMGVFAVSSAAFVLKNTVDGIKEIWVKQKTADIHRNYQEEMIEIENRSFSGKKQIIRYMLNKNERELNNFNKMNNISFKGNKENPEKKEKPGNEGLKPLYLLIGAVAVAASAFLIRHTMKNIRKIGEEIESFNAQERIKKADSLKGSRDEKKIEKELTDGGFEGDELEATVRNTGLTTERQEALLRKITRKYAEPPDFYGERGKPAYTPNINDISGHIYNAIVHPDPLKTRLFFALTSLAGVSYAGTKFVEANKEVQVEKAKADIDLDMNDKLVRVQLENFRTKKQSAANPLIEDYKKYAKHPETPKAVLRTAYNGIFDEIKNGPPFVYD